MRCNIHQKLWHFTILVHRMFRTEQQILGFCFVLGSSTAGGIEAACVEWTFSPRVLNIRNFCSWRCRPQRLCSYAVSKMSVVLATASADSGIAAFIGCAGFAGIQTEMPQGALECGRSQITCQPKTHSNKACCLGCPLLLTVAWSSNSTLSLCLSSRVLILDLGPA